MLPSRSRRVNISALTTPDIVKRNANRLFYGWWIVGAAIVIQGLQGGLLLQSFGAYFLRLQEEFGWSSAALAWSFSILQLQNGLLGPVQGLLVDRFGPRVVLTAGVIVLALGFLLLSQIQSLLTFYLAFLVLSVGFGLSGYLTLIVAVANWFQRRRSLALALSTTGLGLGGMLVPLVAISLSSFGWRNTAIASAIIILAVGLPLMPIIRGRPERYGMRPDGGPDPRAATNTSRAMQTARDFTVGEAIRTRAFWLISFGHGSALLVVGAIMVHLIPHLVHRLEVSLASAALVVTVMTMTSMVGQIGGGLLGDRLDKRLICAAGMVAHCVALLGITFATSLGVVYFFAILHGLAWGGRGPLMGAIRADYFGRRSLGTIMGLSSVIVTLGIMFGPVFAGWMADQRGDYQLGFVVLASMTGMASVFFLAAKRPPPPTRRLAEMRRRVLARREQQSERRATRRTRGQG